MKITEKNRYLIIPVRRSADETKIYFYSGDRLVRDLMACVDFENPDYNAYYDLKTFMGTDITILCDAGELEMSDCIKYEEDDDVRPTYHFAAKTGWINDPNGLIFYEGKYHLFYQYNPIGTVRGTEHWGHAVSEDLVHWEEWDVALFPDDMGTIFSGSAIEDKDNISGMKVNEHNPLVLFYTATGGERTDAAKGKPFTQCMAISTDGGKTFEKYKNNPIIGELGQRSRDPNVVYDEENKAFIMAIFADRDFTNNYEIYKSFNLVDWTKIDDFIIPGERVCPDIYTLTDNGKTKWVFSGGHSYYFTADLDIEKGFVNVSEPKKFGYGAMYAAQTFNGLDRRIRLGWVRLSTGPMAEWGKSPLIPTKKYSQILSIPVEIGLKDDILRVAPAFDFEKEVTYSNISADGMKVQLLKKPLSLHLKPTGPVKNLKIKIFGNVIEIEGNVVRYTNLIGETSEMPFEDELKIFTDNIGYDIFSADKYYTSYQAISDYDSDFLELEGDATLEKLEWGYSPCL